MQQQSVTGCADHDCGVHALRAVDLLPTEGRLYQALLKRALTSATSWCPAVQDRADESDAAREKFFVPESAAPKLTDDHTYCKCKRRSFGTHHTKA